MDSEDEIYCYESEEEFMDNEVSCNLKSQKNFTVLKEEDIKQRQEADIAEVSTILSVSKQAACMLLQNYNWDVNTVQEAWFSDEDKARKAAGLLLRDPEPVDPFSYITCKICFDSYSFNDVCSVGCGHCLCRECWAGYISSSIKDGPGCLTLRCPIPKCGMAVGTDFIMAVASNEDKEKYRKYLVRSYIEGSKKIKWCPAPNCECAVEYVVGSGSFDVCCHCSNKFCWNCTREAHPAVDCETVYKWIMKNESDTENVNWILAYTKPCPKCKKSIQKNSGCNHMTCRAPCCYEFCWICMGSWQQHDMNACNGYRRRDIGDGNEEEIKRKKAKQDLERYVHYYERWAANNLSLEKAIVDLHKMETEHYLILRKQHAELPESQLEFVVQAWQQIVECRRVLKWSYAYGFYLPEDDDKKKEFFEYLQGQAENGLERLHHCAEKELQPHLSGNPLEDFLNFRQKLVGLTRVTQTYFGNLVTALENGLTDVKSKSARHDERGRIALEQNRIAEAELAMENPAPWVCEACTYLNLGPQTLCKMCTKRCSGTRECDRCSYLNTRSATVCQMCELDLDVL